MTKLSLKQQSVYGFSERSENFIRDREWGWQGMRSTLREKSAEFVDMRRDFAGLFDNSAFSCLCVDEFLRSFLKKVLDDHREKPIQKPAQN